MKTIGLLGGTGWSSTISYYSQINQLVNKRLGGHHSAQLILRSVDYHDIMSLYGSADHEIISLILKQNIEKLICYPVDFYLICCNTLHKYYQIIKDDLPSSFPPCLDITDLTKNYISGLKKKEKVLFLATKFTMEDGFFSKKLEAAGIDVVIPNQFERDQIHKIHSKELMHNLVTSESKLFFDRLLKKYSDVDFIILACSEFQLIVDHTLTEKKIIDTLQLHCEEAVEQYLNGQIKDSEDG